MAQLGVENKTSKIKQISINTTLSDMDGLLAFYSKNQIYPIFRAQDKNFINIETFKSALSIKL